MFGDMEVQHNVCTILCYRFSLGPMIDTVLNFY